jgi:hypothetical protein
LVGGQGARSGAAEYASGVAAWATGSEPDRDLSQAVKDAYVRSGAKKARDWPHKKTEKPPGAPKIQSAAAEQRQAAKRVKAKQAAP